MSVTQIDLDDEALAEAMRLMRISTKKESLTKRETVNAVLRDYVERINRLEAAEKLAARGARGEFDQTAEAQDSAKRARRAAFE